MSNLCTDQYGIGFVYFRWHCLAFSWSECRGINDKRPGMAWEGCLLEWEATVKHVH